MLCDAERKDLEQTLVRDEGGQDVSSKFPEWPRNVLMALQSEWWGMLKNVKRSIWGRKNKD